MLFLNHSPPPGKYIEITPSYHGLEDGFVYLHEIDPSIIIEMKYAGNDNFIGTKIDGYIMPVAILTKQAANALKNIQKELRGEGFSLVVYDAYRPSKAVRHFVDWAKNNDEKMKSEFYPHIEKEQIISSGYISMRSAHSRGSTVDLTIIEIGKTIKPTELVKRILDDGREIIYHDDNSVDMGSSFDLFDEISHHDSKINAEHFNQKRNFLKQIMLKYGFNSYSKEWWHYSLIDEPFPNQYFDFDVK